MLLACYVDTVESVPHHSKSNLWSISYANACLPKMLAAGNVKNVIYSAAIGGIIVDVYTIRYFWYANDL